MSDIISKRRDGYSYYMHIQCKPPQHKAGTHNHYHHHNHRKHKHSNVRRTIESISSLFSSSLDGCSHSPSVMQGSRDVWSPLKKTVNSTWLRRTVMQRGSLGRMNLFFGDQYPSLKASRNSSDSAPALQHQQHHHDDHRTHKRT